MSIKDELEFDDVLTTCMELYSDILTKKQLKEMAKLIMEMDQYQNKAYDICSKITLMTEKPDVFKKVMANLPKEK